MQKKIVSHRTFELELHASTHRNITSLDFMVTWPTMQRPHQRRAFQLNLSQAELYALRNALADIYSEMP
jgi:hypothetical protein